MMRGEGAPGSDIARAESLGIHIIARPAAILPRSEFGGVIPRAADTSPSQQPQLSENEWIVGDSHEYFYPSVQSSASASPSADCVDESCSENITDEILSAASSMFQGVDSLLQSRAAELPLLPEKHNPRLRPRLLQQCFKSLSLFSC